MTEAASPPEHPSFFWPRLVAFAVDYILASAISLLILIPFTGDTDRLRLGPALLGSSDCDPITSAPATLLAVIAPSQPAAGLLCSNRVLWIANGQTITLVYDVTRTEHTSSQKSITIPVDALGNPITPLMPQGAITCAILTLGSAIFLSHSGQTPGKRLLRLRVHTPSLPKAILRETLKLLPYLLIAAATLAFGLYGPRSYDLLHLLTLKMLLIGGLAWTLALIGLYLLPILRWRGATLYDRWLGLSVTRG